MDLIWLARMKRECVSAIRVRPRSQFALGVPKHHGGACDRRRISSVHHDAGDAVLGWRRYRRKGWDVGTGAESQAAASTTHRNDAWQEPAPVREGIRGHIGLLLDLNALQGRIGPRTANSHAVALTGRVESPKILSGTPPFERFHAWMPE